MSYKKFVMITSFLFNHIGVKKGFPSNSNCYGNHLSEPPPPPPPVSANTASSHQVQKSHNSSALVMGLAFLFDNAMKSHAIIFLEKLGFCQTCFSPTQKTYFK